MIYRIIKNCFFAAVAAVVITACSDDLLGNNGDADKLDGMGFDINVIEQADIMYEYGQTRCGSDSVSETFRQANEQKGYPLEGISDLYVHRMPLPFVGIHPNTVNSGSEEGTTRAPLSEIASNGINFHDSLTIWGYTSDDGSTTKKTLFNANLVQKINGWRTACEWPYGDGSNMKFYAISPAMESLEDLRLTNTPAYATQPTFTYTVPDEINAQRDLVYGESTATTASSDWASVNVTNGPTGSYTTDSKTEQLGKDNKQVKLKFYHTLTAIRFAQGSMPVGAVVKSIELQGVYKKGDYTPALNNVGSWSNQSTYSQKQNYTITATTTVSTYTPGSNVYIDGGNVLFLMPQTVPADAKMVVTINVNGTDRTMSTTINGDVWNPGYTVTYKVTVGEVKGDYYLVIDPSANYETKTSVSVPTANGTGDATVEKYRDGIKIYNDGDDAENKTFTIHSFRNWKNYDPNQEFGYSDYGTEGGTNNWHSVAWEVVGFANPVDGGFTVADYSLPSATYTKVVSSYTASGSGGTETFTYTVAAKSSEYDGDHEKMLRTINNVLTSTMNLSTHKPNGSTYTGDVMTGYTSGNIYNTANSYIINAGGTYCFPIVYGNSYQNGSPIDLSGNTIFKDHNGNAIKTANILAQVNNYSTITREDVTDDATYGLTLTEKENGLKKKYRETKKTYGMRNANDITTGLLWQDVSGLFGTPNFSTNPSVGTIGFINFTMNQSNMRPGNGVIALYGKPSTQTIYRVYTDDAGTVEFTGTKDAINYPTTADYGEPGADEVLWSWHIWVTDEVYPNKEKDEYYYQYDSSTSSKIPTLRNSSGSATANILPVNLGWVPDNMEWHRYIPREVWVKIRQTEPVTESERKVAYLRLRREAYPEIISGTSTLYQWGRPNALPMKEHVPNSTKNTIYNASNTDITNQFNYETGTTLQSAITQPMKFIKDGGVSTWGDLATTNANLWGSATVAADGSVSGKTLYDPCPPGFCVPQGDIFNVFSLTGTTIEKVKNGHNLNTWTSGYDALHYGIYLFTTAHTSMTGTYRYTPMVYMPSTGYWTYSGGGSDNVNKGETSNFQGWTSKHDVGSYWAYCLKIRPHRGDGSEEWTFFNSAYQGADKPADPDRDKYKSPQTALPIRPGGKGM